MIGIFLFSILLYYFGESDFSQQSIYELNWDIKMPSDLKKLYHIQDKHDFQGKGNRYTLFVTDEIHTLPLITLENASKELQSFDGSSKDGRNYDIEELLQTITTELKVPDNKMPRFDEYYEWQKFVRHGNILIVLYLPDDNSVYFVEKLL